MAMFRKNRISRVMFILRFVMSTVSQWFVGAWTRYVYLPHTCPTAS